jgi:PEP-CTERM motif
MKVRLYYLLSFMVFLVALSPSSSSADPIGPNCNGCYGAIYTLQYSLDSSTPTTQTYDITYTIDASGYNGMGNYITTVAVNVGAGSHLVLGAVSLDGAPGGTSNWTVHDGGESSSGCDGSGIGFECAQASTVGSFNQVGKTVPLVWVFDITVATGFLDTSNLGSHVKADFGNVAGAKSENQISLDITDQSSPAPEPASMLLFGTGLFAIGGILRRRKSQVAQPV